MKKLFKKMMMKIPWYANRIYRKEWERCRLADDNWFKHRRDLAYYQKSNPILNKGRL